MKNSQIFWTAAVLFALWFAHPYIVNTWPQLGPDVQAFIIAVLIVWEFWSGIDRYLHKSDGCDKYSKVSILYAIYVAITWFNRTLNKLPRLWP